MRRRITAYMSLMSIVLLAGCDQSSEPVTALYEVERVSLDKRATQFREWAQNIVGIIGDNNRDLQTTIALVEKEQKQELSEIEAEQFDNFQKKIDDRNNEIAALFAQSDSLQLALFTSFHQYLGKLDSGAQYCGKDNIDPQGVNLPGLANQSAWPQLEDSYRQSFKLGKAVLSSGKNFSCEQFLPTYETLRGEVEAKIDSINQLLKSLQF